MKRRTQVEDDPFEGDPLRDREARMGFTKVPLEIAFAYQNELDLKVDAPPNLKIKILILEVVLPTFGGETSFDIVTYFRGVKMDENLNCCKSGEPG